jgi:hypothetical protein
MEVGYMAKASDNKSDYICQSPIMHDGIEYGTGETLTLTDQQAARLGGLVQQAVGKDKKQADGGK